MAGDSQAASFRFNSKLSVFYRASNLKSENVRINICAVKLGAVSVSTNLAPNSLSV